MKLMKVLTYFILGLGIFLVSCSNQNVNTTNFSQVYGTKNVTIKPEYLVYHFSEQKTKLYFKINSNQILYARKDKTQPYQAQIILHYELFSAENKKEIVDSATIKVYDTVKEKTSKWLSGEFEVKANLGKKYTLKVYATDKNRNNTHEKSIEVNKLSKATDQFFLLTKQDDSSIMFDHFVSEPTNVIVTSELNKGSEIYAFQYFREFPIAAPPFANSVQKPFQYKPDEQHKLPINDQGQFNYLLLNTGFIHFIRDTTKKEGLTIFGFEGNYPKIKNIFGMVDPLRFISSNTEFDELTGSENKKKSIDVFWLSKAGNEDRAREVIKKYYNRVEDANDNFTSYVEGWKTDRGMVSIVYGTPKTVRTARDEEIWYYGEETNSFSLQFTFVKVDNPFSQNDYKLLRAAAYKTSWYRAVDAWRSGRVYWAQY